MVNQYYTNPEDYFEHAHNEQTTISTNQQYGSEEDHNQSERKEDFTKTAVTNEYFQTGQINNESDQSLVHNIKNTLSEHKESKQFSHRKK